MTTLQLLAAADPDDLTRLGISSDFDIAVAPTAGKFDNRPTWDNGSRGFDNRPTWDNWSKSKNDQLVVAPRAPVKPPPRAT